MLKVGGVELHTERQPQPDGERWMVVARWRDQKAPRQFIIASGLNGTSAGYVLGAAADVLRHVYEQGRADAALGF